MLEKIAAKNEAVDTVPQGYFQPEFLIDYEDDEKEEKEEEKKME